MVKVYKSLDSKGLLINKDTEITVLYFDYDKIFLFIMDKFYVSHFRDNDTHCHCQRDCSIFHECTGGGYSLCINLYNLMGKGTGPRLYFTELKLSLFLSKLFVRSLKWK